VSERAEEKLLSIAGSISDGVSLDWNEIRRGVPDADAAMVLEELQLLQGLAAAHATSSSWGSMTTLDVIGRGSFATVYRAFDADLHRDVALKVTGVQESARFDPQRAVQEARLLARVRHPNVVTVYGAHLKENAVALSMELIKGETLDALVRRDGSFRARDATLVGLDLCRAVAAVHEAGLLHGDIKAHNVMRENGGRIVLMDFGTGKDLRAAVQPDKDFAGTPIYLAPEVFAGQPRTQASDIYSLGVLLYYLSTAAYPVEGDTRTQIDRLHSAGTSRRRLQDVRPDLPGTFVSAVDRALEEEPSRRYDTVGAFATALSASLDAQSAPSRPSRLGGYRPPAAVIVTALLLSAIAGAYFLRGWVPFGFLNGDYRVEAALYRVGEDGPHLLRPTENLVPGDQLFLRIKASIPTFVYVVNEDDRGNANLLFPLPSSAGKALPATTQNQLPGTQNGKDIYWQVTTPGLREHFVIFVSPERLHDVEQQVATLPAPRMNEPVAQMALSGQALSTLRSVGGLVTAPAQSDSPRLSVRYTTPLGDQPETAHGLWVRQITFDNGGN
jgi:hypothetical protein